MKYVSGCYSNSACMIARTFQTTRAIQSFANLRDVVIGGKWQRVFDRWDDLHKISATGLLWDMNTMPIWRLLLFLQRKCPLPFVWLWAFTSSVFQICIPWASFPHISIASVLLSSLSFSFPFALFHVIPSDSSSSFFIQPFQP